MSNIHTFFGTDTVERKVIETAFAFKGVSVSERIAMGEIETVGDWIQSIAKDEDAQTEIVTAKVLTSFTGARIEKAITDCSEMHSDSRFPTLTELATFSLEVNAVTPIVSLITYDVGNMTGIPWVAYMRGNFLGMWPTNIILPKGSSVLIIKE